MTLVRVDGFGFASTVPGNVGLLLPTAGNPHLWPIRSMKVRLNFQTLQNKSKPNFNKKNKDLPPLLANLNRVLANFAKFLDRAKSVVSVALKILSLIK